MKKILKIMVITLAVILAFGSVSVFAEGEEKVILDNSVFYIDIPENYMYDTESSDNFRIIDSGFGGQEMEFFVEGNLMFPDGTEKASDEEIISKVRRIVEWGADFSVDKVERKTVNGQKTAVVMCTQDFLGTYNYEYYLFATKEAICVVAVSYSDEEEKQEIEKILETFVLNGTYFSGDKPVKNHDFSKSPDYYEEIEKIAQDYYDYSEEFDDTMWGVMGFAGICLLLSPIMLIAFIIIIVSWRKNKKIAKEYESYFGPIEMVRNQFRMQQMYNYGANPYVPQMTNPAQSYPPQQPIQPVQPVQAQEAVNNTQENNIEQ